MNHGGRSNVGFVSQGIDPQTGEEFWASTVAWEANVSNPLTWVLKAGELWRSATLLGPYCSRYRHHEMGKTLLTPIVSHDGADPIDVFGSPEQNQAMGILEVRLMLEAMALEGYLKALLARTQPEALFSTKPLKILAGHDLKTIALRMTNVLALTPEELAALDDYSRWIFDGRYWAGKTPKQHTIVRGRVPDQHYDHRYTTFKKIHEALAATKPVKLPTPK